MTKAKTNKSLAKRVKFTSTGKIMKRRPGQNHFNAKESGNDQRAKRGFKMVSSGLVRDIKALLPNAD